jgi:hypothetical protein
MYINIGIKTGKSKAHSSKCKTELFSLCSSTYFLMQCGLWTYENSLAWNVFPAFESLIIKLCILYVELKCVGKATEYSVL